MRDLCHQVQNTINEYWNNRAVSYDATQQRENRREAGLGVWSRVAASALPNLSGRVLDLGTGSGYFAFILANLGYEVVGCDLSEGMLNIARDVALERTHPGCKIPEFIVSDAHCPDVEPAAFDAITGRYIMWTLQDPLSALLEWKRLLVPGGTLALIDAPWFPAGIQANTTKGFATAYTERVTSTLPLAEAQTIDATAALVKQAGYHHLEIIALEEVYDLDRITGVAPGHHLQLQYLLTAKTPKRITARDNHTQTVQAALNAIDPGLDHWREIFHIAADPTRLELLVALHAVPESTVTQLALAIDRSPNTVTQALARLEKAHFTASRSDGRYRRWRIINKQMHNLLHHLSAPHTTFHPEHIP